MSTKSKECKTSQNSPDQSSSSSFLSNYKWWLVSIVSVVIFAIGVQQLRDSHPESKSEERLFTANELQTFTKDKLHLAILGHVFDVSSAPKFYSETGSYGYYTGRDASRSFYTGKTSPEDLIDDLTGLSDEAVSGIYEWLTFYQKRYPQIGKLVGRYFTETGSPTEHFSQVLSSVNRMKRKREETTRSQQKWPPCNSEWSHTDGKRVWCTTKSGGVERSWAGVPRRYFDSSSQTERCVCVNDISQSDGRFKEYSDCSSTSSECRIVD